MRFGFILFVYVIMKLISVVVILLPEGEYLRIWQIILIVHQRVIIIVTLIIICPMLQWNTKVFRGVRLPLRKFSLICKNDFFFLNVSNICKWKGNIFRYWKVHFLLLCALLCFLYGWRAALCREMFFPAKGKQWWYCRDPEIFLELLMPSIGPSFWKEISDHNCWTWVANSRDSSISGLCSYYIKTNILQYIFVNQRLTWLLPKEFKKWIESFRLIVDFFDFSEDVDEFIDYQNVTNSIIASPNCWFEKFLGVVVL